MCHWRPSPHFRIGMSWAVPPTGFHCTRPSEAEKFQPTTGAIENHVAGAAGIDGERGAGNFRRIGHGEGRVLLTVEGQLGARALFGSKARLTRARRSGEAEC